MDKMDGIQLLEAVKDVAPHAAVVMITGFATVDTAVDGHEERRGALSFQAHQN